ncbi:MAG: hypothetical protein OXC30_05465 [Alphaproteobacteria bacterium]|nr:hypothetical protein [Alphaproteobacteria bacterium]
MINIIIFSLFMCILNAEAAEAAEAAEDPGLLTGAFAQQKYSILRSKLAKYEITVKNSMVMEMCCVLSKFECFQSVDSWTKIDIDTILYTLSQKSSRNPRELAKTFRDQSAKVKKSPTKIKLFHALGQCVPAIQVNADEMKAIFSCCTNMQMSDLTVSYIRSRYKNQVFSQRFSLGLQEALWKYVMCPKSADQRLQPDKAAAEDSDLLTGEAAKRNYRTFQHNFVRYGITCEKSAMLRICWELSQSDCFQNAAEFIMPTEINIILYNLRKQSERNADELAKIFRNEDAMLGAGKVSVVRIIDALNRCVPPVHPNDKKDLKTILQCIPDVHRRRQIVRNIRLDYTGEPSPERYSKSLKNLFWKLSSEFVQDSQPNTDAADWLAGEAAKRHYSALHANFAQHGITLKKSFMLQVCCALSKSDCFQKSRTWLQVDIDIILYSLCKESFIHAAELAQTFRDQDAKVSENVMILDAFSRCIPQVQSDDLEAILICVPNMLDREIRLNSMRVRCVRSDVQRFSPELRNILFTISPESLHKASLLETDTAEDLGWLTGAAAKRHYSILRSKLRYYDITVENSLVLRVCCELSKSDCFQKAKPWLQVEIDIILYSLCKESFINAAELAQTFRNQDAQMSRKNAMILDAFSRCIPEFQSGDLEAIVLCFPNVLDRDRHLSDIRMRCLRSDSQRFSSELSNIVCKLSSEFVQDSQPDIDAAQGPAWFTGAAAQRNYSILRSNLEKYDITVKNSPMLQVCRALSQPDCFQNADVWLQTDIETILYTLCKKSYSNAEELAKTFSAEGAKVSQGDAVLLHAFARCVPEFQSGDVEAILRYFPMLDVSQRSTYVCRIIERYKLTDATRFSKELTDVLCQMNPAFAPDPEFKNLLAYVWYSPLDSKTPVEKSAIQRQMDIVKELPNMLDWVARTMKKIPNESASCKESIHSGLITKSLYSLYARPSER